MRLFHLTIAFTAAALTVAAPAPANTTLKFPSPNAVCIAQAWVPSNTDPTQPSLGTFLRTGIAAGGELRQNDCR
jgi:hypothetical protein